MYFSIIAVVCKLYIANAETRVIITGLVMFPVFWIYLELLGACLSYHVFRGFAKKKVKKSEITMEVGGWVQVSL